MAPVPTSSTYASQIRSDTGSGLGNPDHLRHRSLRSEIRPPPPRFRTGKEEPSYSNALLALPEQQVEDHGQDDREDDARCDRDVEGHISALQGDVAGQVESPEQH